MKLHSESKARSGLYVFMCVCRECTAERVDLRWSESQTLGAPAVHESCSGASTLASRTTWRMHGRLPGGLQPFSHSTIQAFNREDKIKVQDPMMTHFQNGLTPQYQTLSC
jgi:hypothetical protein